MYKKAMTIATKRYYNSTLKIQIMPFMKMPLVFKRSILILACKLTGGFLLKKDLMTN